MNFICSDTLFIPNAVRATKKRESHRATYCTAYAKNEIRIINFTKWKYYKIYARRLESKRQTIRWHRAQISSTQNENTAIEFRVHTKIMFTASAIFIWFSKSFTNGQEHRERKKKEFHEIVAAWICFVLTQLFTAIDGIFIGWWRDPSWCCSKGSQFVHGFIDALIHHFQT